MEPYSNEGYVSNTPPPEEAKRIRIVYLGPQPNCVLFGSGEVIVMKAMISGGYHGRSSASGEDFARSCLSKPKLHMICRGGHETEGAVTIVPP